MFFYRASAETSLKRWGSILDENFQLVLPITPYRSFPPAEVRVILSEGKIKQYWRLICSKLWICLQLPFLMSSYHHKRLQINISYDRDHTKNLNFCFLLYLHFSNFLSSAFCPTMCPHTPVSLFIFPIYFSFYFSRLWPVSAEWMVSRQWSSTLPPSLLWFRV